MLVPASLHNDKVLCCNAIGVKYDLKQMQLNYQERDQLNKIK